jgi:hypothetical protein
MDNFSYNDNYYLTFIYYPLYDQIPSSLWLSCVSPFDYVLPKTFKLIGFPSNILTFKRTWWRLLLLLFSSILCYIDAVHSDDKNQSNTDIFRIGPIPVSPITARSESSRRFDNCKEKSRDILDWLIKVSLRDVFHIGLIRGFRSSCYWTDWNRAYTVNIRIGLVFIVLTQWKFLYCIDRFDHIKAKPISAGLGPITRPIWKTSRNNTIFKK